MGIYKSIYVIGLIDYFTEDYNMFCNQVSQKLQVNIILKKYLNGELTSKQLLSTNYKNSIVVKYLFDEPNEYSSYQEVEYQIVLNNYEQFKDDDIRITKPGLFSCFVPLIISRWDDFVELLTTENTNEFYKRDAKENLNIINELFARLGCNKLYCVPEVIEEIVSYQLTEESENANLNSTHNLFETFRKKEIDYFLELTPTLLSS